jgi:D-glycero-D-manno-heptose 1,7-bisphosphate phosphatase
VINVDHGYVSTPERCEFVPGALDAIRLATDAGWLVFIVTNQSGIARGYYTEAEFAAFMAWMIDEIRAHGGNIDDLRFAPMHPEAVIDAYRGESDWRKPGAGMLLDLLAKWELDPRNCLMIGDQPTDMVAAGAAGIQGHLFQGGNLAEFIAPLLAGGGC